MTTKYFFQRTGESPPEEVERWVFEWRVNVASGPQLMVEVGVGKEISDVTIDDTISAILAFGARNCDVFVFVASEMLLVCLKAVPVENRRIREVA